MNSEVSKDIEEIEIIRTNLDEYPLLKKYFGKIIEQRLQIECFTHGLLTAHLLSLGKQKDLLALEITRFDLQRLEIVLQFGNSCCEDFDFIFREDRLAQYEDADGKIIDMLAEVRAFEFLCRYGFKATKKIRRKSDCKTVDFTAKRDNLNYAIEVTRLGLAQSDEKQPVYDYKVSTLNYEKKCENADGSELRLPPKENLNVERIEREIYDAVDHKYKQLSDYLKKNNNSWKGILFVSSGKDYFNMCRYENKGYDDVCKNDFLEALQKVWQSIAGEQRNKYLHHIIITRGRDLGKAIISPDFEIEEQET